MIEASAKKYMATTVNHDKESKIINDNELRFSREQGFFDTSIAVRFMIGMVFALSVFLVLHFREVAIEIPEVNSIAPHYVVAQVPFEFVDEEATLVLRQEAVRDISHIYRLMDKEITERRLEFENDFFHEQKFPSDEESSNYEEVYRVLDKLQKALEEMLLADPRTIKKLQETGLYTENFQIFTPSDPSKEVTFPSQIWSHIQKIYLPKEDYRSSVVSLVLDYFKAKKWKLEDDINIQRKLRKKVESEVAEKYTHISAGSRILDQGEQVTTRHIAMIQSMKKAMNEGRNLSHVFTLLGSFILTLLLTAIAGAFLYYNHSGVLESNRKLCLLAAIIILTLLMSKLVEYFVLSSRGNLFEYIRYPLLVPFAAILTCNLLNSGLAIAVSAFLTIILSMTLAFNTNGFMIMNLVGGVIAVLSTHSLRRRKELFAVCAKVWLGCVAVILSMHLYWGTIQNYTVFTDLLTSALFMIMTAVIILGILPLLESTFRVMSDVTLMEYMDPNHELLRRLSFEAPGTYQHTLVVCNIAEAAAMAIGANALFCRVATLYHDIGKVATPHYFTENMHSDVDMHKLLTPVESAQAIIFHVSEGVTLARKAGLPEQFIDIIKEHHGTTLVYYFYRKQLEQVGGDPSSVDLKEFRYAGPKPRSKESAIIMIADSFEAASRSLDRIDESTLFELIDRLVREKAEDGQFDECLLTFEELSIVKRTMVKTLAAAHHSRIKYPRREKVIES